MSHNGPLFQLGIDSTRRNGKAEIGSGGYFFPGRQVETVYTDSSRRTRRKLPSSETRGCAWNTKERFVARYAHRDQTSSRPDRREDSPRRRRDAPGEQCRSFLPLRSAQPRKETHPHTQKC